MPKKYITEYTPLCPAYMERASSFMGTHSRPDQLLVLVDRHRERFGRDNSMTSSAAADKTFVTLSFEDVVASV